MGKVRPIATVERRKREPATIAEALRLLQEDAKAKGTDKLTREEIIEEIAAYRREKRQRTSR